MCALETATNSPSAALNIAEIADRYTGLLHGYRPPIPAHP
jgi:hypothetical protein